MRISDWSSDVCSSDLVGGQHRIIEMDARRAVHQRMMDLLEGRDLPVGQPRYQRDPPQRSGAIEQPGMEPRGQLEHLAIAPRLSQSRGADVVDHFQVPDGLAPARTTVDGGGNPTTPP